jgi:MraZ protein
MIYKGQYREAIGPPGHVPLPSAWREGTASGGAATSYTITRGLEGAVFLYPPGRWAELEARLGDLNPGLREVRAFYRMVMMWAGEAVPDEKGRIEIPPYLADFAGLEGEALLLGAFDHIEIWDPGRWDQYLEACPADYDTLVRDVLHG